jgi:hypothetical protein
VPPEFGDEGIGGRSLSRHGESMWVLADRVDFEPSGVCELATDNSLWRPRAPTRRFFIPAG